MVQLPDTEEERTFQKDYIEREAKFKVYWGDMADYVRQELRS